MFNINKFKAILLLKGKTLEDIAKLLDIDIATLYRKMNGKSDFWRSECKQIRDYLDLKNPEDIFFE